MNKRASFACAARLVDTVSAGGVHRTPELTLINSMGDDISKYVCLTVQISITGKIIKFVNI